MNNTIVAILWTIRKQTNKKHCQKWDSECFYDSLMLNPIVVQESLWQRRTISRHKKQNNENIYKLVR